MDIDREAIYQFLFSGAAVLAFVAAAAVVAQQYGPTGEITQGGGTVLVGAIAGFVVAMFGAGLWLEYQDFSETTVE